MTPGSRLTISTRQASSGSVEGMMRVNLAASRQIATPAEDKRAIADQILRLERELSQLRARVGMPAMKCPEYPKCFAHGPRGCSPDRGCPFAFYAGDKPCRYHDYSGCNY